MMQMIMIIMMMIDGNRGEDDDEYVDIDYNTSYYIYTIEIPS